MKAVIDFNKQNGVMSLQKDACNMIFLALDEYTNSEYRYESHLARATEFEMEKQSNQRNN